MEQVAQRIKELIDDQGLSNGEFAKRTNLNPAIISHILSGRNNPSLSVIQSIKDEFTDVNLDYLINGQGEIYNSKPTLDSNPNEDSFTSVNIDAREAKFPKQPVKVEQPDDSSAREAYDPDSKVESTDPIPNDIYKSKSDDITGLSDKAVEQIVIFYSDGSFKAYHP